MDKQRVLQAYRRGLLTTRECAQILGIDSAQLLRTLSEDAHYSTQETKQMVNR